MIIIFVVGGLIIAGILGLLLRVNQRGMKQSGTAYVEPDPPKKNRASDLD